MKNHYPFFLFSSPRYRDVCTNATGEGNGGGFRGQNFNAGHLYMGKLLTSDTKNRKGVDGTLAQVLGNKVDSTSGKCCLPL